MSTTTQGTDPRDDWPEGYRGWLSELPDDVEHELSDLLDAAEGIKSLADTAILIHQNADDGPVKDPEPGKLEHRKAKIIAPMREDAARAVWALYRRLDDFFGLWREYSVAADRGAFRLASEAEKGSTPGDAVPPENVLEKVATTLARVACLSAQEPTGRLAEVALRKAGYVADQQLIEVESVTGISYEDDLQGDANAWAKGRVREIAAELEGDA